MAKMGDLGLSFADVEEAKFDLLPNGKYHVRVERWEETETKGGKAPGTTMYKAGFSVVQAKHKGRWVFTQFVMDGNKVGMGILKAFFTAIGIPKEEIESPDFDPDEAYGEDNIVMKELDVRVGQKPAQDGYDEQNKVSGYSAHKFTDEDMLS